ncbi:MAG: CHAD domain-containing protein [Acidobacteria bacterium]|nr:CHAD domain-containing protein [Acidobacteriota bacterium]
MPLPGDLLRRGAEEAVRLIALDLLSHARETAPRCLDPEDSEGLHDFRVSIRRLRSTLSAWKGLLRALVEKRDRKTLAGFQKRTGASRDAEVALEWLETQVEELEPRHRPGYEWVEARLRSAARSQSGDSNREVCAEFVEWADGFESRLEDSVPTGCVGLPYPHVLADRLERIAHRLELCVDGLGGDRKRGPHKVRIAGKRLRYLVEPVRTEGEVAASLVERCKRLQDVLGTLNDAHVLDDLLKSCIVGEPSEEEAGVLALCRLNAARARVSYRSFRVDWLDGAGMQTLLDGAAELARELRS